MRKRKNQENIKSKQIQHWFAKNVTYQGEKYTIDLEQATAVADNSKNTIVVARAGSGKTRTIVAKIVYLIAHEHVAPEEIMAFVFNANATREINQRLADMRINNEPIAEKIKIAYTFHAFSRKIVYDVCGGRDKCGKILGAEKDIYLLKIVQQMLRNPKYSNKIRWFIRGEETEDQLKKSLPKEEIVRFANMMAQFTNRAQQKYLGGKTSLKAAARDYLKTGVTTRERLFVELGVECFRRYHWYLLNKKLPGYETYGTDFNLIVSWASKLIKAKRDNVTEILSNKKYLLIDEYQDFSQLFLSAIKSIRQVATEAKLFVVGDDWQAINRFAGSEVEYFKNFERYFPTDVKRYEITTNYRCNYMIVDTARKFMKRAMHEKGHFKAHSKRAGDVILVNTKRKKSEYLKTLVKLLKENRKAEDILILHRNNDTHLKISLQGLKSALKREAVKAKVLTSIEFDSKVKVMTMHKSKGLEAEIVIILEADEGIIPKTHPDTHLYEVFGETEEIALDDQKRLFYVAITRAKKRLYIMHEKAVSRRNDGFIPYLGHGISCWEE